MTVIEVFADVTCPFTHVGLRRFVDRREELGRRDLALWVRAWPLEVVNGQPLDGHFIATEVDDIRRQLGSELFAGFDESAFPASSVPAMALAAAAYDRDMRLGETVSLALRDLLFEHGEDIGDRSVLDGLADEHGVEVDLTDKERVLADHADGMARGVVGSPHFFTPSGGFFCPSLDVRRDEDDELLVDSDPSGFDEFIDACLS